MLLDELAESEDLEQRVVERLASGVLQASGTGDERFHIVLNLNSNPYAWMQTYAEDFADAIDEITFDGSNLEVTGELFVNEPYSASVFPLSALPEGASLTPFTLHASCG